MNNRIKNKLTKIAQAATQLPVLANNNLPTQRRTGINRNYIDADFEVLDDKQQLTKANPIKTNNSVGNLPTKGAGRFGRIFGRLAKKIPVLAGLGGLAYGGYKAYQHFTNGNRQQSNTRTQQQPATQAQPQATPQQQTQQPVAKQNNNSWADNAKQEIIANNNKQPATPVQTQQPTTQSTQPKTVKNLTQEGVDYEAPQATPKPTAKGELVGQLGNRNLKVIAFNGGRKLDAKEQANINALMKKYHGSAPAVTLPRGSLSKKDNKGYYIK